MQNYLVKYLFQTRHLPLPSLGALNIQEAKAAYHFGESKITAPKAYISLQKETSDTAGLTKYIAAKTGLSLLDTEDAVFNFCKEIKDKVNNGEAVTFGNAGKFFKDSSGQLAFHDNPLPDVYFNPVEAIRVIHPDAEHSMKVGDTETTTTAMEAYYAEEEPVSKDRWWIWATILAVLGISVIVYHFYTAAGFSCGNQTITGN